MGARPAKLAEAACDGSSAAAVARAWEQLGALDARQLAAVPWDRVIPRAGELFASHDANVALAAIQGVRSLAAVSLALQSAPGQAAVSSRAHILRAAEDALYGDLVAAVFARVRDVRAQAIVSLDLLNQRSLLPAWGRFVRALVAYRAAEEGQGGAGGDSLRTLLREAGKDPPPSPGFARAALLLLAALLAASPDAPGVMEAALAAVRRASQPNNADDDARAAVFNAAVRLVRRGGRSHDGAFELVERVAAGATPPPCTDACMALCDALAEPGAPPARRQRALSALEAVLGACDVTECGSVVLLRLLQLAEGSRGSVVEVEAEVVAAEPQDLVELEDLEAPEEPETAQTDDGLGVGSVLLLRDFDFSAVHWAPDETATHCRGCDRPFSMLVRRHHCRYCGEVHCGDCTSFWARDAASGQQKRLCAACFAGVRDSRVIRGSPAPLRRRRRSQPQPQVERPPDALGLYLRLARCIELLLARLPVLRRWPSPYSDALLAHAAADGASALGAMRRSVGPLLRQLFGGGGGLPFARDLLAALAARLGERLGGFAALDALVSARIVAGDALSLRHAIATATAAAAASPASAEPLAPPPTARRRLSSRLPVLGQRTYRGRVHLPGGLAVEFGKMRLSETLGGVQARLAGKLKRKRISLRHAPERYALAFAQGGPPAAAAATLDAGALAGDGAVELFLVLSPSSPGASGDDGPSDDGPSDDDEESDESEEEEDDDGLVVDVMDAGDAGDADVRALLAQASAALADALAPLASACEPGALGDVLALARELEASVRSAFLSLALTEAMPLLLARVHEVTHAARAAEREEAGARVRAAEAAAAGAQERLAGAEAALAEAQAALEQLTASLTCAVCLESIVARTPVALPACGHLFCAECAERVRQSMGTCPTCRAGMAGAALELKGLS